LALPVQKGFVDRPFPARSTRSTFPASESGSWALSASAVTVLKSAASPTVRKMVPADVILTLPIECEAPSEGRQSLQAGRVLQDEPTTVPRMTTSLEAVSPVTVTRVSRAVFGPS
jgi:hypothetical protein